MMMVTADLMDRLAGKLLCPACGAASLAEDGGALSCRSCPSSFPVQGLMADLSRGDAARRRTLSQRVMESPAIAAVYEKFWRPMVTRPFSDLSWEKETSMKLLDARDGDAVLDLACGTGNFTRSIVSRSPRAFAVGADISLPMLRRASRYVERDGVAGVAFVRTDAGKWPFRPGAFSRALCAGALHLFPDPGAVARSVFASLQPGGVFVCATYLWGKRHMVQIQKCIARNSGFHWFTLEELEGIFADAGFSGFGHYTNKVGVVVRAVRER